MNINITQGNTQENVNSNLINKLYNLAEVEGNSLTLTGNLYSLTAYEYQVIYLNNKFGPNLTITVPEEGRYIHFDDPEVEAVLLAAGISTDGTGITARDAANATLTSSTFQGNTSIQTFDEFRYFTKANTNPPSNLFKNCSNLEKINLTNCTKVSIGEFSGCTSLEIDSEQLSNLTNIEHVGHIFNGVSFKNGIFKAPLNYLQRDTFGGIVGLQTIDLSEGKLTTIFQNLQMPDQVNRVTTWKFPKNYFSVCEAYVNLNKDCEQFVYGLDSLTDFGRYFFHRPHVQNPVGLKLYTGQYSPFSGRGDFNEIDFVHSLFFPKIRTTVSVDTTSSYNQPSPCFLVRTPWGNARFNINLLYFKDITTFGLATFYKTTIQNLVINNVTPPTYDTTNLSLFSGKSFESTITDLFGDCIIGTLWVPDSAVATYQADPLYSGLTIKGINTKTNGTDYDLPRFATIEDWQEAYDLSVENNAASPVGLIEEYM